MRDEAWGGDVPTPDLTGASNAFERGPAGRCGHGQPFRRIADVRIAAAMRFAEARLDTPPTTAALAASVGLSQFHFLRLFQTRTGETVSDYIRRIRLDAAALHLRGSREPIVAIALAVGYGSQAAFTRAFTGRFGRSPASYRRAAGRGTGAVDPGTLRTVAIRRVAAITCLGRRYLGSGCDAHVQWRDFLQDLPPDLGTGPDRRLLRVVHDDPRITPPEQIRVDCCLVHAALPSEIRALAGRGIHAFETGAGMYAVIPEAEAPGSASARYDVIDGWLAQQERYRPRGTGCLEFHAGAETPADGRARELFVPVRTAGGDAA